MKKLTISLLFAIGICAAALAQNTDASATKKPFSLPDIPEALTNPTDRAGYLTEHYWDSFDFADKALPADTMRLEQPLVDFLQILPIAPASARQTAFGILIDRALTRKDGAVLALLTDLFDKYLYDVTSPMRNEELYILALQHIVAAPKISKADKVRPQSLLALLKRNRLGETATDFTFQRRDGSAGSLAKVSGKYTLLIFNSADCADCRYAKVCITMSRTLRAFEGLTILSVCVDSDLKQWRQNPNPTNWIDACDPNGQINARQLYDLKIIPALYLLDAEKRVVLREATVSQVEAYLLQFATPGA